MEHVVFYPSAEGVPSFERVESLEAAVGFVEQLRNANNITDFEVFSLTSVPLSFRAYYHVEVPASADAAPAAPVEPTPAAPVEEAAAALAEAPAELVAEEDLSAVVETPAAEAEPALDAAPVAETATGGVDDAAEEIVPAQAAHDEPAGPPAEADDDRSAQWVAEAPVIEAPAVPVVEEAVAVAPAGPFADAPPVTPPASGPFATPVPAAAEAATETAPAEAAVPVPSGRRSMGFFAR